MNLIDLTPEQLKRAASIKEQIDGLNKQLRGILVRRLHRDYANMSASVKKKIAAAKKRKRALVETGSERRTIKKCRERNRCSAIGTHNRQPS